MNTYLEFEKPIESLDNRILELRSLNEDAPSEMLLEEISNDANDKSIAAAIAVAISVLKENEDLIPSRWKTEGRRRMMESRL